MRAVAQARTLAILLGLDGEHKRRPLRLVYELGLIRRDDSVIYLENAGLDHANLSELTLRGANLRCVDLRATDLSGSDLSDCDLGLADLRGADLRRADLRGANLKRANLSGASVTPEQLADCKTLDGATTLAGNERRNSG